MEKIITSIFLALLPLIATYLGKLNKDSVRKSMIDDAQKRIDFLKNYFDIATKLVPEDELPQLRSQLSAELNGIKYEVSSLDRKSEVAGPPRLNTIKSLFLTFKPLSVFGLLWAILFYFVFIILSFLAMGFFMDDNSNFTMDALAKNLQDSDLMFGVVILFGALLLFRWLAVGDYRRRSARMAAKEEPAVNMNLSAA